jgi:hypothetical protein
VRHTCQVGTRKKQLEIHRCKDKQYLQLLSGTHLETVEDPVGLGVLLAVGLDLVLAAQHEGVVDAAKQ